MPRAVPEAPLDPRRRRAVVRQSVAVGVATGAYGISFGALSVAAGFSILQTALLSALLFTGGSQFAIAGVIGGGGSAAAAVATSTMLGVRNGLYGLQTRRLLDTHGWRRLAAAHLTIDESTAVGTAQPEPAAQRLGFWATGLTVFGFWNLLTLVGAFIGRAIGDPRSWGLDAAAAAAFVALLWPRLRQRGAGITVALAAAIALIALPMTPSGVEVLVASVAALVVSVITRAAEGR